MIKRENKKVNFIKHLVKVNELFWLDSRVTPYHISLYHSLFMSWNHFAFSNPLSISRQEQMKHSKIGSVNTYLKCLKELDSWSYIKYMPSRNPQKGSEVYLYIFDTTTDTIINFDSIKSDTTTDTSSELPVRPLLNSKKEYKTRINSNSEEIDETQKKENIEFKKVENQEIQKEKNSLGIPKNLGEVEAYFSEKEKPISEANKFFNYYEANGWLVGKNKMKNWRAAANNWMLNAQKFNARSSHAEKINYLHVNQDKDYSIPL